MWNVFSRNRIETGVWVDCTPPRYLFSSIELGDISSVMSHFVSVTCRRKRQQLGPCSWSGLSLHQQKFQRLCYLQYEMHPGWESTISHVSQASFPLEALMGSLRPVMKANLVGGSKGAINYCLLAQRAFSGALWNPRPQSEILPRNRFLELSSLERSPFLLSTPLSLELK